MRSTLAAAALIVTALSFDAATAIAAQPTTGHRQVTASIAPADLGWGSTPSLLTGLGRGSGTLL